LRTAAARAEPAPERAPPVRQAPPPLLEPASPLAVRWPELLPKAPAPAPGPVAWRAAPVEAAAPEISIEIGRIELRSDAPKPARAVPAGARRAVPSLADYLRGKEAGG
jgi:hypothetical protein